MATLLLIGWAALLLASVLGIYLTWGDAALIAWFPEGWRWWKLWTRLLALAVFAAVVLSHPF